MKTSSKGRQRKAIPLHREVREPKYRQRVEQDQTKYTRKVKHKGDKND